MDNPATGAVVGEVPDTSAAEAAQAVERARRAQRGWAELDTRARAEFLARGRRWLLAHREEIADLVVEENGKAREDAVVEIVYCASGSGPARPSCWPWPPESLDSSTPRRR
ncbi:aldehyde dehydrogenase family protein [Streptomyces sp. NPDC050549]|uniref:aldehyde dehydrogenase family protein n=1 Tax=Streptomyces sp. NPDC050549 TaxID=3155406 RepID=UPI0034429A05